MPTTREQLRTLVRRYPHAGATELARALGVSRTRINQLVDEEGLEIGQPLVIDVQPPRRKASA